MAKIKCLICGKEFDFLAPHLARAHGTTDAEYRQAYDIAQGEPLASDEYREMHRQKILLLQAIGALTYEHLPTAVKKSRASRVRPKRGSAAEKQQEVLERVKPWSVTQIHPGGKRSDGRDADQAREYQREYRKRKAKDASNK